MDIKSFLGRARTIDREIESKLKQTQDLRLLATQVTSTLNDMPGSPTRNTDKMCRNMAEIVDLEHEIDEDISRLVRMKKEIKHCIDCVSDDEQRLVLLKRYLNFLSWEQIAMEMGQSIRSIHRLHAVALVSAKNCCKK